MAAEVKLFGMWASPMALRVEWALKFKGVKYEYVNEDLHHHKSPELLRYNPVHKKVPVLVHAGRPVVESLVIIEYIDEEWKDGPAILPADPYDRAMAHFWAKFVDDKILPSMIVVYYKAGEEQQQAAEELKENLKILGEALNGRKFFGGEMIGYVDIVAGWLPYWLAVVEAVTGVRAVDASELPAITAWFEDFLNVDLVKQCLPPCEKLCDFNRKCREHLPAAQSGQS